MAVVLIPAEMAHVAPIASRLRVADAREAAAFGHAPDAALSLGLAGSTLAWTAMIDGKPEGMLGVVPVSVIDGLGRPWMLGTDVLTRNARGFVEWGPAVIFAMHEHYRRLENMVAAGNRAAVRLLLWLGFVIDRDVRWVGGVGFWAFGRGLEHV